MTKEEIIAMAKEAGYDEVSETLPPFIAFIERFARLVSAAEREACAKLVEDWDSDGPDPRDVAAAMRARSE